MKNIMKKYFNKRWSSRSHSEIENNFKQTINISVSIDDGNSIGVGVQSMECL